MIYVLYRPRLRPCPFCNVEVVAMVLNSVAGVEDPWSSEAERFGQSGCAVVCTCSWSHLGGALALHCKVCWYFGAHPNSPCLRFRSCHNPCTLVLATRLVIAGLCRVLVGDALIEIFRCGLGRLPSGGLSREFPRDCSYSTTSEPELLKQVQRLCCLEPSSMTVLCPETLEFVS